MNEILPNEHPSTLFPDTLVIEIWTYNAFGTDVDRRRPATYANECQLTGTLDFYRLCVEKAEEMMGEWSNAKLTNRASKLPDGRTVVDYFHYDGTGALWHHLSAVQVPETADLK